MKLILIFCILFFSFGCQLLAPTPKQETKKSTQKVKVVKKKVVSSMIRGTIETQFYEKNSKKWHYKLEVIDIASDSLQTFSFTYPKKLYNIGDLVYVILDQNDKKNIKDLYLIKKDYVKQSKTKDNNTKIIERKKSKKTPWISTPKTETIKLD